MKTIHSVLFGLAVITAAGAAHANAKTMYKKVGGFTIENCHEHFEKVNFCSKKFVAQYRYALKTKKINFNQKYILHFLNPRSTGDREVVAIDPHKKHVIVLGVEINPTGKVKFSKNSDTFCFAGSIEGYRQSNEGNNICYRLRKDKYSKFGVDFINVSYNH